MTASSETPPTSGLTWPRARVLETKTVAPTRLETLAAAATEDEITDVLLPIAPVAASCRVIIAVPGVADAFGCDIDEALEDMPMVTDGAAGVPGDPASGPNKPPQASQAGRKIHDVPSRRQRVRRGLGVRKQKLTGSWAGYLWRRLVAMDFMNQAMSLAGTLLLCAFPFFLVIQALRGRSAATAVARRLNLNEQAAADVGDLFASSATTSAAVAGIAWVLVLCGICAAASIQSVYQQVFELQSRGARDMVRQLIWLALAVATLFLTSLVGPFLGGAGPVVFAIAGLIAFTGEWWFTSWFLLGGRVSWRRLFPCALATGAFFVGMLLVFSFTFSGMVISTAQKYGPIGTVFALMSWLIAIGVVIILGAATGLVWQERGLSFRAALRKVRRAR